MPSIPTAYLSHFMRGVVDGDGSVMRHKSGTSVSIHSASESFIRALRDAIPATGTLKREPILADGRSYFTLYYSVTSTSDLAPWLYANSEGLRLERKYAIYAGTRR
jgi:hypothetical protein